MFIGTQFESFDSKKVSSATEKNIKHRIRFGKNHFKRLSRNDEIFYGRMKQKLRYLDEIHPEIL